jgi:hypothetical protein
VQINVRELRDHEEESVGFGKFRDLFLELKVFEDLMCEVLSDLVRITFQLLKIQLARVVKGVAHNLIENGFGVFDAAALECGVFFQHLRFGRLQNAVKPTKNRQREDHSAVLVGLIGAA